MATDYGNWKRDLGSGVIAGIIWGWIAMAVVAMTMGGLENGMLRNLVSFSVGGLSSASRPEAFNAHP